MQDSFVLWLALIYIWVQYIYMEWIVTVQIIKRANEAGENPLSLSKRFSNEFLCDMAELQCLPPTHEPRVSDHMDQIKDMIAEVLLALCTHLEV